MGGELFSLTVLAAAIVLVGAACLLIAVSVRQDRRAPRRSTFEG